MDIEEWEVLSDDGFLEIHDDGSGNKIVSRKYETRHENVFQMNNYLNISPRSSQRFHLDHFDKEIITTSDTPSVTLVSSPPVTHHPDKTSADQDVVSQVFFKKENEFVDMKMDSPRSNASTRETMSPFDAAAGTFKYEDDDEASREDETDDLVKENNESNMVGPRIPDTLRKSNIGTRIEDEGKEENGVVGRFNLWRWSLTGVGAICSVGVAAATICIVVFTTHQKTKKQHNRKLRFQIYTDDKRIKQVVQHATKLNEAISMAKGVPLTRAHFTVGGYYDAL